MPEEGFWKGVFFGIAGLGLAILLVDYLNEPVQPDPQVEVLTLV